VEHENSAVMEVVADHPAGRLGPIPTDGLSGAVTITSNTGDIVSTENGWTYLPAGHIYSVYPNSGQLGTRVGITGVRLFGGGNSIERIYLAGTLADISVATDTLAIVLANAADESAEPGDAMLVSDTGAVVTTDGIAFTYVPRAEISAINPTSGHFGTRFTITGEGMRAGGDIFISVTLASVEAREVVGTDTVITAVAGSSARRTGDVVITMDTGATTTLVNGWSYVNAGFIQNVRPDSGHGGTQVTISGQYLLGGGSEIASLTLAGAEVDSINDFSEGVIRAVAQPHAAIRGDVRIVMSTGAVINQIDGWTYVPEISIGTLAPASGQHGTIVTIPGAGMLGGGASIDSVTLSGVEVEEIRTNDRDDVIVVVAAESPGDGLTSGSVVITANTGATATLENAFTYVVAGSVDRIDPNSGQFGTRVEVHGSSFYGGGSSVVSVFFGDTDTTIISETDSIVVIGIPATAELGSVDVLIVSDNGARTLEVSGWTFLETGNIELVSPSSGQGSAIVTITGTGLFGGGAQVASVHLAEVEARILGESDTEIVVVVAAHPIAATGSVRILMDSGALIERVDGWSYVTPGVVSSVVPAIGQIGTQVTINGAGLMSGASSLVMVTLASETVGSIVSNTNSMVVIIASASSGARTGAVVLIASTGAVVTSGNAWEYIQTGEIQSVSPRRGRSARWWSFPASVSAVPAVAFVTVMLGSLPATITSQSNTEIQVEVHRSNAATAGPVTVYGAEGSVITEANVWTYLQEGVIDRVEPNFGQRGTVVTISGRRMLGGGTRPASVELVGVAATVASFSDTSIELVVASGTVGLGNVVITSDTGSIVTSVGGFTYLVEGSISTVQPSQGQLGTNVLIAGSNLLGGGTLYTSISLGGVEIASYLEVISDTVVVVTASESFDAGNGEVKLVSDTGAIVSSNNMWSYDTPSQISSITPTSGQFGTMVTISGTNLLGVSNGDRIETVTLNGVEAELVWFEDQSELIVIAQHGLASGAAGNRVYIEANSGAYAVLDEQWSYIERGQIASITPATGQIGTEVTIAGTNLLGGGSSTVRIQLDGVDADVTSSSNSEVLAVVNYAEFSQGTVVLTSDSGAVINSETSIWTYGDNSAVNDVQPRFGQEGTRVTITGDRLRGHAASVTTVTLAGVQANITYESDEMVLVVAAHYGGDLTGSVELTAIAGARTTLANGFEYRTAGVVDAVTPTSARRRRRRLARHPAQRRPQRRTQHRRRPPLPLQPRPSHRHRHRPPPRHRRQPPPRPPHQVRPRPRPRSPPQPPPQLRPTSGLMFGSVSRAVATARTSIPPTRAAPRRLPCWMTFSRTAAKITQSGKDSSVSLLGMDMEFLRCWA